MSDTVCGGACPEVSVIMPAYNAERFLEEAVRSVQAQTFTDWEMIIIDDYSADATCTIAERLSREDSRIRFVRNEENQGVAKTRNRGFDLCRGDFAALLDSDDLWHPEKLAKQVELARQTGADIIYCSYAIVDENGQKKCDDFIVPEATDFEAALTKSVISCSTALLSRKILDTYRFETEYYHEDLVLWLRLLRDGFTARGVTDVLAAYRVMDGTRASNKIRSSAYRWQIYRNFLGLSLGKSTKLLIEYAFLGLKKYRKA